MNKTIKNILQLFISKPNKPFSRKEIEESVEDIGKRTILRALSLLEKNFRIEKLGGGTSTKYKFSQNYHQKFENKLYIYQNQVCVGYLGFEDGEYLFAYDSNYLVSEKYFTIFEIPVSLETQKQTKCFVDFEEILPEGIDKDILIEKTGNATEFFLLKNNNYSTNDLIFSSNPMTFDINVKIQSYLLRKDEILGKNNFPNIYELDINIDKKSLFPYEYINNKDIKDIRTISLSGYQHKLQVVIKNGKIAIPNYNDEVEYFIKPYHPQKADPNSDYYFPHLAINEHLYMSFAKNELGFDVPESGIFKAKNDKEYHYIVKYFDRYKGYKFQRKEFSSYMGLHSDKKYNTSSEKLFETASKVLPREEDRLKMLEYYFYSFVIKHEDMHTKNISTIYDNGKVLLAPLYDIATTSFYGGVFGYESHLPINGKQTNIRLKDFLVLVKKAKVSKSSFLKRASFILQTYKQKLPSYIEQLSSLPECSFYIKERPNTQDKKSKIKDKVSLQEIMMKAFKQRIKTLEENLWFEQLNNL